MVINEYIVRNMNENPAENELKLDNFIYFERINDAQWTNVEKNWKDIWLQKI